MVVAAGIAYGRTAAPTAGEPGADRDWLMFGGSPARLSSTNAPTAISPGRVAQLQRVQATLPGIADSSAIYLHGAQVNGSAHDTFFLTTSYGKTVAVDAAGGQVLWTYTPPGYDSWQGTRRITNATPLADADRQYIYATSPDGYLQKLSVSDGHAIWRTAVTLDPVREKLPSPINIDRGHLVVTTDGYIGDRPPYQGHVAILDTEHGTLLHVWNSLCSDRTGLIQPASCPQSDSGIWGRAGAVIEPNSDILVATGNALWDGKTNWGDAVIELDADATHILGNYTPTDTAELNDTDRDLGSTSPVLLGGNLIAQGGKDGKIRLLSLSAIAGATPHQGGELQIVSTPSGTDLFTAPAVWHSNGVTWMFAADNGGTAAWQVQNDRLVAKWQNSNGGTSPLVAGGMLFVYDPRGGLRVYVPDTGALITTLECGPGHWNSPILVDGRIALPEGNANRPQPTGILDIWSVPARR